MNQWTESESYVTTDGQSASLSWYKAPIRGLRPDFYFITEYGIRLTVTFLIPWGALSDERTGLSFVCVCAAGPCQRSLSRVLVPWDLRPYFTVSDLRLPFSSPPTTRRVMVEVFFPASTRVRTHSNLSYPSTYWFPINELKNELYFITTGEPNISHHVLLELSSSVILCLTVAAEIYLPNRCPAMDYSAAIRCSWNKATELLFSNGHIRHNITEKASLNNWRIAQLVIG
jgi:hypothetical protein